MARVVAPRIARAHAAAAPADLADRIAERVDDALADGRPRCRDVLVAGLPARTTVDARLASGVLDSLAGLPGPDAHREPLLRLHVAPLERDVARALGLDHVPPNGIVHAADGGATVVHLQQDAAAALDRVTGTIRALMSAAARPRSWQAKPLQLLLSVVCADRGIDLLHAGVVSLGEDGIVLAGRGGSGKSTVALASLLAGLDYLGDDCVAVAQRGAVFRGFSVFGSGCLERHHLAHFPWLVTGGVAPDGAHAEAKEVVPVGAMLSDRLRASAVIRAVVLPHYTGADAVTVRPARRTDALLALAPGSLLKRAVPAAEALGRMSQMIRSLPCYHLEMGRVEAVGGRVRALIEELAA